MKGPSLAILGIALLIASIATFAGSNSQRMFSIGLVDGPDLAARRTRMIEFAAQHDWLADFARAGIELPASTTDQILEPLVGRAAAEGEGVRIFLKFSLELTGVNAFVPQFERIGSAVEWIEARLALEAIFAELESGLYPERARGQLWRAYGTGFDPELWEFLSEWQPEGLTTADAAFVEDLRARLEDSGAPFGEGPK